MFQVFLIIQILITIAMVGAILLQRNESDGLAGLGGGGGGGNAFMTGRAAANFLTRTTAVLATAFMLNSLWLAIITTSSRDQDSLVDELEKANDAITVPVATEKTDAEPATPETEQPLSVPTPE
ncbi:MAG: preprotein translocase subunit SecG [Rickettsiales bacterium]